MAFPVQPSSEDVFCKAYYDLREFELEALSQIEKIENDAKEAEDPAKIESSTNEKIQAKLKSLTNEKIQNIKNLIRGNLSKDAAIPAGTLDGRVLEPSSPPLEEFTEEDTGGSEDDSGGTYPEFTKGIIPTDSDLTSCAPAGISAKDASKDADIEKILGSLGKISDTTASSKLKGFFKKIDETKNLLREHFTIGEYRDWITRQGVPTKKI